jgi:predicted DNA-binding transcriptional regulator AlpA
MAKSNEIIGPVLRRPAAMAFTGLSFTQFDELVGGGDLPPPIKISDSGRTVVWLRAELEEWLAARMAKRDLEWAERLAHKVPVGKPGRPRKQAKVA